MPYNFPADKCISSTGLNVDDALALCLSRIDMNRYDKPRIGYFTFDNISVEKNSYEAQSWFNLPIKGITNYGTHEQNVIAINDDGSIKTFDDFAYVFFFNTRIQGTIAASDNTNNIFEYAFRLAKKNEDDTYQGVSTWPTQRDWLPSELSPTNFVMRDNYTSFGSFTYTNEPIYLQCEIISNNKFAVAMQNQHMIYIAIPLELE